MMDVSDREAAGGWRMLCASVFWHAVESVADDTRRRGRSLPDRSDSTEQSRRWLLNDNVGLVTFSDCCSILGISEDVAREKIAAYVSKPYRKRALKRDQYQFARSGSWQATD